LASGGRALVLGVVAALLAWVAANRPDGGAGAAQRERNPFALPPGIQKKNPPVGGEAASGRTKTWEGETDFKVTTILIGTRTKVAAINGKLVREGEEVEGFRVVGIFPAQVILMRGKEKKIVKLDYDPGRSFRKTLSGQRVMGQSQ
jgi:hypothetical protein